MHLARLVPMLRAVLRVPRYPCHMLFAPPQPCWTPPARGISPVAALPLDRAAAPQPATRRPVRLKDIVGGKGPAPEQQTHQTADADQQWNPLPEGTDVDQVSGITKLEAPTGSRSIYHPSASSASREEQRYERAKASAAGSLAWRPHSRSELETKLLDKGHQPAAIRKALNRLQELGLQSDVEYAAIIARSKWRKQRWAPSRILQALREKGVSQDSAESGLLAVFGDAYRQIAFPEADSDDGVEEVGTENAGFEVQLVAAAKRKLELVEGLPPEARRRRLVAWLQRRGHNWGTVKRVLARLELYEASE